VNLLNKFFNPSPHLTFLNKILYNLCSFLKGGIFMKKLIAGMVVMAFLMGCQAPAKIKEDVETLKGNVTELQGKVKELEGKIMELEGKITQLEGKITQMESKTTPTKGTVPKESGTLPPIRKK